MRLALESHIHIQAFLRTHFENEILKLPPVHIHLGRWANLLTGAFGILAITFGRHIFVASTVIERDDSGRLTVPAKLIAHEATHIVQYQQAGLLGFLLSYLAEYKRAIVGQGQGLGKAARGAAYFAIKHEREAYGAESAYMGWIAREAAVISSDPADGLEAKTEVDG